MASSSGRLPLMIALPIIDIESIGTGGGSIAWFDDAAGTLRVGPESAAAEMDANFALMALEYERLLGKLEEWFKLPRPDASLEKELVAISKLIRQVGDALESVGETLADGVVEEKELRATVPKLESVIRECAALKYLLEDLAKRGKKKR